MATTRPGEGTKIQISISSTLTDVGNVEEIDGIDLKRAAVKTTHLGSSLHENRASKLPDPGKVTMKVQLDPDDTTHQYLYTSISSTAAIENWKIIFNDGMAVPANCTFDGFLTGYKITNEKIEENLMAEIEITLTSIPVMTAGAAS